MNKKIDSRDYPLCFKAPDLVGNRGNLSSDSFSPGATGPDDFSSWRDIGLNLEPFLELRRCLSRSLVC